MVKCVLVGILLAAITVAIHAIGTAWWIRRLRRMGDAKPKKLSRLLELRILCMTATVLLLLHITEVLVWAFTYLLLPNLEQLESD